MASLRVLAFDHEGRPVQFDTWLDDLQLYLLTNIQDGVSMFDHVSGAATVPPTTADRATRSQWLYCDAAARLAIRNHMPLAECTHFGQHRTAQALYDAVVTRYSSPATAAPGRLLLPYLFPEMSAFATVLNLWPRVSLSETSPTLHWTGEVGDASVFRVWGSRAFVRDTFADKLSPRAIPCGPAPSGVSQVDPLPGPAPVQVAVDSGAARGAASGGAESEGAETGGAEPEGAETGGAAPGGVETGDGEPGGAEPEGVEPGGTASKGADSGGAEPQGAASSGGSAGASPRQSQQKLREWFVWRARLWSGATGAGGAGAAGSGGAGVAAGVGVPGGTVATGPGGARTRGTGAAGSGGVEAGGAGVGGTGAGGAGVGGTSVGGAGAGGAGANDPGGAVRPRPYFVPMLKQVLGTPSSTSLTPPLLCQPPDQSQPPLQPASPLPFLSPYTEQSGGLIERRELASRPVSPVRTARRVPRSRPPPVPGTQAMTLHPSSVPQRVPMPAPPESSLPQVPDPESDRARAASPSVSRLLATTITYPSFESAVPSALVAELLDFATACRLDYTTALVAESASATPPSAEGECALSTDVLEDR
ncbi:unnamed protein product [Closterium sp. NIES-54]